MPTFYTNYNPAPKRGSWNNGPSKTLQQFKDEADINVLIGRYMRTGFYYNPMQTPTQKRMPQFGDYSALGDFQEQQQRILDVYDDFARLPAKVRERFGNNPALFVEFAGDPANTEECIKLGIFEREKAAAEPVAAEAVKVGDGVAVADPLKTSEPKAAE